MKKLALVIDPGHYPGYNPGVDPTVYEGNVMYSLAEAEKKLLRCELFGSSRLYIDKRDE